MINAKGSEVNRKMWSVLWIYVLFSAVIFDACVNAMESKATRHPPDLSSDPLAVSPSGTIRGSWLYTRRGRPIRAFRGVRYAEAPVGELRFQPPRSITQYPGEVNATADGPACPQPVIDEGYNVHEDCLRLNVYTPANTRKPLPVIVFMHAGGFYSISGRSDIAGPSYLLDKDVVLVTINYRLASLGFLSTGDKLAPGNNGFKDQIAALKWVKRNIAAFGGNPNLVTLAGYSAGSFSVMLHMVSPMSKGLFHRAISMSGSPISQITLPSHQRHLAVKQAELLNCPSETTKTMLDCLRTKTSVEIGNTLDSFFEYAYDPVLVWIPIIEPDFGQERFLVEHPLTSLKEGRFHQVPYIISQTKDEFFWKAFSILNNSTLTEAMNADFHHRGEISFQLPPSPSTKATDTLRQHYLPHNGGKLTNDSETASGLGKLYSDGIIGFGVHKLVNAMTVYSRQPVYYYEFAYVGTHSHYTDPVTGKPTGAAHHDDLIYLFSINASFPIIPVSKSQDSDMVDFMTAVWLNFATTGDPNPLPCKSPSWPAFTHSQRKYLRIDSTATIENNLFHGRFQVWEGLYNPPHCEYCLD